MKPLNKVALLVFVVLVLDQWLKFHIKLNYEYGQETNLFGDSVDWAYLKFVENEGMAFGITFDWEYGKLLLSMFRIVMVGGLIWYLRAMAKEGAPQGFLLSVGLITAGAIGNIIDSAFYGMIFTDSQHIGGEVAELVPPGDGYGTFLHGKVVDMLYFPIHNFVVPDWVPQLGGENFLFFSPIFNIADAAITVGVLCILIFQRYFFKEPAAVQTAENQEVETENLFAEAVEVAGSTVGIAGEL